MLLDQEIRMACFTSAKYSINQSRDILLNSLTSSPILNNAVSSWMADADGRTDVIGQTRDSAALSIKYLSCYIEVWEECVMYNILVL